MLPAEALISLLVLAVLPEATPEAGIVRVALIFVAIFIVRWLTYLTLIAELSVMIQRGENFITYAVAYNWSQVIRIAIMLPAVAIFVVDGPGGSGWGMAIFYAAQVSMWFYSWAIARLALNIPRGTAVGTVVIEVATASAFAFVFNALV